MRFPLLAAAAAILALWSYEADSQIVGAVPLSCERMNDGIHLFAGARNQGQTWTAVVSAFNCEDGAPVSFLNGGFWDPDFGSGGECVGWETGDCQARQPGILKRDKSTTFFIDGESVEVNR